jgi:hypothetical protein
MQMISTALKGVRRADDMRLRLSVFEKFRVSLIVVVLCWLTAESPGLLASLRGVIRNAGSKPR